jgi:hypothetical protein
LWQRIAAWAACLAFEAKVSQFFLQSGRRLLALLPPRTLGAACRQLAEADAGAVTDLLGHLLKLAQDSSAFSPAGSIVAGEFP